MVKNLALGALAWGGFFLGPLSPAGAAVTITILNDADGMNVNVVTSGSIDLNALTNYIGQQTLGNPYLFPATGGLATGTGNADLYGTNIYDWAPYGTEYEETDGTGFGVPFGLLGGGDLLAGIAVPAGYISNNSISSLAVIPGTIASLRLTPGSHLTTFSSGAFSDSVLINIGAVPEPGWTGLLVAGGMLVVVGCRWGRRPSQRPA